MRYFVAEFNITASAEQMQTARELLADMLGEVGFESFEDTDEGLNAYIQQDIYSKSLIDQELENFIMPEVTLAYETKEMPDVDWNAAWEEEGFEPIIINDDVMIYDANKGTDTDDDRRYKIGIAAKQAFGTGTHDTTRMIVSQLYSMPLEGKRLLDCGCGTGILGIAALKFGASEVVAYDIDEWSVENTQHNAELNEVENLHVLCGDSSVLSHVSGVFDVVMANINRNILLADMPVFREVMTSNGKLILSGFYGEDVPLLTEKAGSLGLSLEHLEESDGWTMLVFTTPRQA